MDAGRHDDGRQHVRQRAQGAGRCAVQRAGPTARQHDGVSRLDHEFQGGFTSANWWPADLGVPSATGAQNDARYAIFPSTRRLAIQINGVTKIFDTGEHRIGGVQQQQGGGYGSVSFSSQLGTFAVSNLSELGAQQVAETPAAAPSAATPGAVPVQPAGATISACGARHPDPFPGRPGIRRASSRPSSRWPRCTSAASSLTRSTRRRRPNCSDDCKALAVARC